MWILFYNVWTRCGVENSLCPKFPVTGTDVFQEKIKSFDLIVLTTDHDDFNYNLLQKNTNLIIDIREKIKINNKFIRG